MCVLDGHLDTFAEGRMLPPYQGAAALEVIVPLCCVGVQRKIIGSALSAVLIAHANF